MTARASLRAADARTWLFVPGDRPERFDKARASGADEVICDLEDAVQTDHKDRALLETARWLSNGGAAWVRINGSATEWHNRDVSVLAGLAGLRGFVVPKAEIAPELQSLRRRIGAEVGLIALIESARGVRAAYDIAASHAVDRLAFGSVDFADDIRADETDNSLLLARSTLVVASRAAGKPAPVDGVTRTLDEPAVVYAAAVRARQLGFTGKLCVHPAQLAPASAAFRPSAEQIRWAEEAMHGSEPSAGGARATGGQLIDKPVLDRARRTLHDAPASQLSDGAPSMHGSSSRQPLDGITVVALEQAVAAPFATRQLADLGARVIKIERPDGGDFARGYDRTVHGQSSYFVWLNRGKQSVALDVKKSDDRIVLDALVARADVFIQNLAPGAVDRLGLDTVSLRRRHPRLITCSVSGYGHPGPYAAKKAYDLLVQCEAGLLSVTGTATEPAKAGVSIADIATGMYAYSGILSALYERERIGEGADVEVAMLDALGEWMMQPFYFSHYSGQAPRRTGARHASIAPYGPYVCGDGAVAFIGVQNDREWAALCQQILHRPDLVHDPRFAHNPERVANDDELLTIIEQALASVPIDEVVTLLDDAGIANAQIRAPAELASHPQLTARHRWSDVDTPAGTITALLPPVTVTGRDQLMGRVPALGEHTQLIRDELRHGAPERPGTSP